MNYLDLFHGIGGFALGAHMAGMKFNNHYCSDIEPYAQELYKLRFPDSIQLGDIAKIDTSQLPEGDWIISGGFPCQDISIAGKGAGIHGKRSGLWFEYWRIIRDLQPRFAIMENVSALTFRGLDAVLGSLAEIGYNAEWQDIRASDMGAPHRRERIWIVAYPSGAGVKLSRRGIQQECKKHEWEEFNDVCENVAYPGCKHGSERDTAGMEAYQGQRPHSELYAESSSEGHGRPDWSVEPDVGRLAHGIPHRVDRLKGLGNAIVPQIADLLFRQIKENLVDNSQQQIILNKNKEAAWT